MQHRVAAHPHVGCDALPLARRVVRPERRQVEHVSRAQRRARGRRARRPAVLGVLGGGAGGRLGGGVRHTREVRERVRARVEVEPRLEPFGREEVKSLLTCGGKGSGHTRRVWKRLVAWHVHVARAWGMGGHGHELESTVQLCVDVVLRVIMERRDSAARAPPGLERCRHSEAGPPWGGLGPARRPAAPARVGQHPHQWLDRLQVWRWRAWYIGLQPSYMRV